jgi:3',5'-cyclic AMP phosphodiesterase CpdA
MILASDLHFGHMNEVAADALYRAATRDSDRLLIIAGDLTQNYRAAEFEAAGAFLQRVMDGGVTVVCTPGNHDYGRWKADYLGANQDARALYREHVFAPLLRQSNVVAHDDADVVVRSGRHVFVALRSVHAHALKPRRIASEQLAWANGVLRTAARAGDALHLVTHVGLWGDGEHGPQRERTRLEKRLLQPHRFASVIHGHDHAWQTGLRPTPKTKLLLRQISLPTLSERLRAGSPRGFASWDGHGEPRLQSV